VAAAGDIACAECGRKPREDEKAADEWPAYRDIDDDLPVFCPECVEREFGSGRAPTSRL
jgi:DNA-directed RNA polymerase subunit RPC12/RpoP